MSSHPGKSYPTFTLKISEEPIYANTLKDKLFGYVIEAPKGPVNEPTYVASNEEAIRVFGVDFAPHFYQQSTGLIIIRVGIPAVKADSITFNKTGSVPCFKVTAVNKGKSDITVKVTRSINVSGGYRVTITIPDVTSRTFSSLPNATAIVKTINNKFAKYIKADLLEAEAVGEKLLVSDLSDGKLTGGSYGKLFKDQEPVSHVLELVEAPSNPGFYRTATANDQDDDKVSYDNALTLDDLESVYNNSNITEISSTTKSITVPDTLWQASDEGYVANTHSVVVGQETYYLPKSTTTITDTFNLLESTELESYRIFNNTTAEYTNQSVNSNISLTAKIIYKYAFDLMQHEDVIGVAALSELQVVQAALNDHINECVEDETAILRFGITGFTEYNNPTKTFELAEIIDPATEINSEYIIYIGQGCKFKKIDLSKPLGYEILTLSPIQSVMLYTGIRSALSYDEAIFGGEDKKILQGVIDVLPIVPNTVLYKDDREELNESGVITFKKEYDRVTFLEGVTTSQDSDVLSYENIMSIVIYVTKRLITIAKSYQGKKLTEDLKESLKTALSAELQSIQQNDGSLVAIAEYNIPPYDVEVESAAMVRFNEEGQLIRESKVVARVKIVPVGALRDVELGVIVI